MQSHKRTRLSVERLEDRTTPSYGLGYAVGLPTVGGVGQIAIDPAGNAIVSSAFSAAALDLGPEIGVLVNAGSSFDHYVAKRDPQGDLLWAVHAAAAGFNSSRDVAVDGVGNVVVAGEFTGSVEIRVPGATSVALTAADSAGSDGFLAKIAPSGELLWARTFDEGGQRRVGSGIATDAEGNVYATGEIPGSYQMFVTKYSGAAGTTLWDQVIKEGTGISYGYSGTTYARGKDLALDSAGNVYTTGMFKGCIDFDPHPTQSSVLSPTGSTPQTLHLNDDIFVLKMNAGGGFVWAGNVGGTGIDSASGINVDGADNVFVHGRLDARDSNDADPGAGTLNLAGGDFIVKLAPNRDLLWGRSGLGETLALDAAGNLHTLTNFSGTIDADPGAGTFNVTAAGTSNLLFRRFDSVGRFVWADVLGGAAWVRSLSLAVDQGGNLYTNGLFKGTADFDPSAGTYLLTSTSVSASGQAMTDTFVAKLVEIEPPPAPLPPPAPGITISDVSQNEGKKGKTSFTFTVSLSAAYDQPVTMSFQTVNGTATTGNNDYIAKSGTITFAPGETTKTITIEVKGDSKREADETFYLDLFGLSNNALFTKNRGIGTILNDD